jgi:hypothetical protein
MKLEKKYCEVCNENDEKILHLHHIVERVDPNCTNDNSNLAILCPNCHSSLHLGRIKIVGVFPSTKLPNKRTLVFVKDGVCNVPGMENEQPAYVAKPESMKVRLNG